MKAFKAFNLHFHKNTVPKSSKKLNIFPDFLSIFLKEFCLKFPFNFRIKFLDGVQCHGMWDNNL